ncbi:MAG: DMT family transporter [Desulfofustis sp.]|jgi:drug/metabolite transporter (DMT)-like permease
MGLPSHPASSRFSLQFLGWLAVFGSAFCFYLATAIIRWADGVVAIDSAYFTFSRFLLGFIVVCSTMLIGRQRLKPRRYHFLIGRTVSNTVAVFCFYKAVEVGSLAEANILNMTYPLFVAIFSWFLVRDQRDKLALGIVGVAFGGVWLILAPGSMSTELDSLWGLCSGFFAAWAMIYLNLSRRYHDSQTILFFMFGLGAAAIFALFREAIFWPSPLEFNYLFWCSAAGVLGQYLLTYGFLFVTAVEGSIISSSRILLAALTGSFLVGDPPLMLSGWMGALLIFGANSMLALRRAALNREQPQK